MNEFMKYIDQLYYACMRFNSKELTCSFAVEDSNVLIMVKENGAPSLDAIWVVNFNNGYLCPQKEVDIVIDAMQEYSDTPLIPLSDDKE